MAVVTGIAIAAGVGAAVKGINAGIQAKKAKEEQKRQEQIAGDKKLALEELEANRQEVINPAANMANEFENIGVATQAAKFEAEEADIALANTLDTIMATGGGSGGATALARAALESKRGISASIQKQEQSNQVARAEGATAVSEAKAQGEAFKFQATEAREDAKINRTQVEITNAEQRGQQERANRTAAQMDMVGAVGDVATAFAGNMTGGKGLFG